MMKLCTGFWVGMGTGVVLGAAVGMMNPSGKQTMKTQVGRSIEKLGHAVDHAVDNIVSELH
ncbi:MAG: YtxH domain-containing protein [Oscillibacter sp.]